MILLNFNSKTKTIIVKIIKIGIHKRFTGGGKKVVEEVIKTIANLGVKAKLPILRYDPSKINNQLNNNYFIKKYLPIYEQNGLLIPYPIETVPLNGISGSYTLPQIERTFFDLNQEAYIKTHSYTLLRYIFTMYGGKPITTLNEVLARSQQLFTEDSFINNYQYPKDFIQGYKAIYPLLQHWLALDNYNYVFETKNQEYPSNLNINTSKVWTLQRNIEIQNILKTHKFKFEENKDEIRVMELTNPDDINFLKKHTNIIRTLAGQPHPEMVGQTIGINLKTLYTIETKILAYPEQNLKLLSSHSSMSPLYQAVMLAERMAGQVITETSLRNTLPPVLLNDLQEFNKVLKGIIKQVKSNKISTLVFENELNENIISFFNQRINTNTLTYNNISYVPSIITRAYKIANDNYFQKLQKENSEYLHNMIKDVASTLKFKKHFPLLKELGPNYDMYDSQLSLMLLLKKYNLLNNFYAVKTMLLNNDIDVL